MSNHDSIFSATLSKLDNVGTEFIHSLMLKYFGNGYNTNSINHTWRLLNFPDTIITMFYFSS